MTINNLVLSGGGIKGISYCGAFKRLSESAIDLDVKELCCVSVGSIFGLAYTIGYSHEEMIDEIMSKKFTDFVDLQLNYLFTGYGMDSGNNIITWLETLLIKKGFGKNITFNSLFEETGVNFRVCVTNLNKYKLEVFDNTSTPELEVLKGIRMSISLPVIYTMQTYNNDVYVDGGLVSNYPIHLYQDKLETTLGCILLSDHANAHHINFSFETYIYNVFQCFVLQRTENTFLSPEYEARTIAIKTKIDNIIRFKIKRKEKKELIQSGYDSVAYFCEKKMLG